MSDIHLWLPPTSSCVYTHVHRHTTHIHKKDHTKKSPSSVATHEDAIELGFTTLPWRSTKGSQNRKVTEVMLTSITRWWGRARSMWSLPSAFSCTWYMHPGYEDTSCYFSIKLSHMTPKWLCYNGHHIVHLCSQPALLEACWRQDTISAVLSSSSVHSYFLTHRGLNVPRFLICLYSSRLLLPLYTPQP